MADKNPVYSGVVQTDEKENSTEIGRIAFWANDKTGDKQPLYRGVITKEDGTKFRVALWKFKPKESKADL